MPYKEILLLILGTLSSFLIWRIQFQNDKIKTIENKLSEKKFQIYSELVYIIFDVFHGGKTGEAMTSQDMLTRLLEIKKNMFLYATDEMFEAFTSWTLELQKPDNNGVDHFKKYFELMILVRKDMGQTKSKISLDDFMLFIMQNETEYLKFKETFNW